MRKKNKLYKATPYNGLLFADLDRDNQNLFGIGGVQTTGLGNTNFSGSLGSTQITASDMAKFNQNYMNSGMAKGASGAGGAGGAAGGMGKAAGWMAIAQEMGGLMGEAMDKPYTINGVETRHGAFDFMDPMYHAANGHESTAGNAFSDAGVSMTKHSMTTGNGYEALIGAGLKVTGDAINLIWGTKTDKERLAGLKSGIAYNKNFTSNASSFDELKNPLATMGYADVYSGGLAKKGWARKENEKLKAQVFDYKNWVDRSLYNNINNIAKDNLTRALRAQKAYGGPIETTDMSAINYGFMSDYLANKTKEADLKNKLTGISPMPNAFGRGGCMCNKFEDGGLTDNVLVNDATRVNPIDGDYNLLNLVSQGGQYWGSMYRTFKDDEGRLSAKNAYGDTINISPEQAKYRRTRETWNTPEDRFKRMMNSLQDNKKALGGVLQSHGADWNDGLTIIGAGGSHEENPNDGVQLGVDPEGKPNLVEEGEVVFNDYVYSNRIELDAEAKKKFHFGKKQELTYAEAAKKLEKETAERPNDPISQAALKAQMETLAEQQERQKQEMEAEKARAEFEALSPEEQVAVMQQAQQQEEQVAQEQAAQEAAMQEQAMAQQQMSPEEAAMIQQQQMAQPQPTQEEMVAQQMQQPMMAYGGQVNRFDLGGLAWIKKNHPEVKNPKAVAEALEKMMQENKSNFYRPESIGLFGGNKKYSWNFDLAWSSMMPATTSLGDAEKHFNKWVKYGLSKDDAFNMSFSDRIYKQYMGDNRDNAKKEYDAYYNKLVTNVSTSKNNKSVTGYKSPYYPGTVFKTEREAKIANRDYLRSQTENKVQASNKSWGVSSNGVRTRTVNGVTSYLGGDGKYHRTEKAALFAGKGRVVAQDVVQDNSNVPAQESPSNDTRSTVTATPRNSGTTSRTTNSGRVNVGSYKGAGATNRWNEYGLPGLQEYLLKELNEYNDANATDESRDAVRQRIVNTINGIQQSYYDYIAPTLGKSTQSRDENVGAHQRRYQEATNNRGFWDIDEEGRYYDKIAQDINKPSGYNTSDNLAGGWVDNYSGPQTWLRYMGATGDSLDAIVKDLKDIGIDYSPYNNWSIGEGKNARQLYRASLINGTRNQPGTEGTDPEYAVDFGDPDEAIDSFVPVDENGKEVYSSDTTSTNNRKFKPVLKKEWPRYVGLLGPAVGLGMQLAGIGKPDYSALDAAVNSANAAPVLANYQPIGNYLTYRPLDTWFAQNALNAQARATDRALTNSVSPSKAAGLLASGYNSQLASGNLFRQAQEYNDALRQKVEDFNRATNMFNAEAYNKNSMFNAEARNKARQYGAHLALQGAAEKLDTDASWYNSLYGNVAGLFKGIGDLGRENAEDNMLAKLLASGYVNINPDNALAAGMLEEVKEGNSGAKGGKLRRRKRNRDLI